MTKLTTYPSVSCVPAEGSPLAAPELVGLDSSIAAVQLVSEARCSVVSLDPLLYALVRDCTDANSVGLFSDSACSVRSTTHAPCASSSATATTFVNAACTVLEDGAMVEFASCGNSSQGLVSYALADSCGADGGGAYRKYQCASNGTAVLEYASQAGCLTSNPGDLLSSAVYAPDECVSSLGSEAMTLTCSAKLVKSAFTITQALAELARVIVLATTVVEHWTRCGCGLCGGSRKRGRRCGWWRWRQW